MTKRIALLLVALMMLGTANTGCLGGMAVSGKVMKFNLDVHEDKWVREAVFLALYVIPVYEFAGLADLLVVNSIEFHTGTNPITGKPRVARAGDTHRVEATDGAVSVSTLREDGSIDFVISEPSGKTHFLNLGEREGRVVARDATGLELASMESGAELPSSAITH
jgi:hypothetical protein